MRPPLPFRDPATLLATWFGVGLMPWAPGTWGSLAALPFAALVQWLYGPVALLAAAILLAVAGSVAVERMLAAGDDPDPSHVVVDEVAGQWLALVPAALDPLAYLVAFVLFRLLDVLKPWPIDSLQRLPGSLGVMADDVAAGLVAAAATALLFSPAAFGA